MRGVGVLLVAALALSGCSGHDEPPPHRVVSRAPQPAPSYDAGQPAAAAVLALVPQSATVITVTDWDAVRVQLGQPELTSESLMSDRNEFWRRAETESPALTRGMLREDGSEYELDYGFTQDDVDWEAHWTGPDGPGWALAFRPDLDLGGVREAINHEVGPLADGHLDAADHLAVSGTSQTDVWGNEPQWAPLVVDESEATYLHRGCVPLDEALGPDATAEDQDRLLAQHPITLTLRPLAGFAIGFGDHNATVRMAAGQADLFERLDVARDWPVPGFGSAWRSPVGDPGSGRMGYSLPDPPRAVALALTEELPFAVCNEVTPGAVPTG